MSEFKDKVKVNILCHGNVLEKECISAGWVLDEIF